MVESMPDLQPGAGIDFEALGGILLLVLGVNAVSAAVPFTPQGAGVQQALLTKVFAGTAATMIVSAMVSPSARPSPSIEALM